MKKNLEKNKLLYLTIPISFNELTQSLQNILIQKEAVEYHDIRFKKLFLNMTGRSLQELKNQLLSLQIKKQKLYGILLKKKVRLLPKVFY